MPASIGPLITNPACIHVPGSSSGASHNQTLSPGTAAASARQPTPFDRIARFRSRHLSVSSKMRRFRCLGTHWIGRDISPFEQHSQQHRAKSFRLRTKKGRQGMVVSLGSATLPGSTKEVLPFRNTYMLEKSRNCLKTTLVSHIPHLGVSSTSAVRFLPQGASSHTSDTNCNGPLRSGAIA